MTISGDIDIELTKALISKYFSEIPSGKNIRRTKFPPEPDIGMEIRNTIYDNVQLPAIIQAYYIPAMGSDDYYAVNMLSSLLSTGQSFKMQITSVDTKTKIKKKVFNTDIKK